MPQHHPGCFRQPLCVFLHPLLCSVHDCACLLCRFTVLWLRALTARPVYFLCSDATGAALAIVAASSVMLPATSWCVPSSLAMLCGCLCVSALSLWCLVVARTHRSFVHLPLQCCHRRGPRYCCSVVHVASGYLGACSFIPRDALCLLACVIAAAFCVPGLRALTLVHALFFAVAGGLAARLCLRHHS